MTLREDRTSHVGMTGRDLRVLHVLTSTQRRGAESFAVTLQRNLAARGHRARPVALVRASSPPELDVRPLGTGAVAPATLRALRREARGADVVIAHGSRTLPACAIALAGTGAPLVYVNIGDPLFWANSRVRRARVRLLFRRVRAIAARTESSRRALVDRFGMRPAAVRVIGNGRHAEDYPLADAGRRARARADLGLDPSEPVAVFVGALSPEKRPDVAVDAVARVPGTRLLVVGDGPLRAELEARAVRDGLRVSFLGTRSDVAHVMAAADVLLLTSDSEGLPGVLIEAGLVGLPVVATDVGFVSDVLVDDRTGVLVPAGDPERTALALQTALARAGEMGSAAHRHCLEHFEMGSVVDAWEELLREVAR